MAIVPAKARLELVADSAQGARPAQVTCYRYDSELANRMLEAQSKAGNVERGTEPDPYKQQRQLKEEAIRRAKAQKQAVQQELEAKGGDNGGRGGQGAANRRTFERNMRGAEGSDTDDMGTSSGYRAPLFDPGWRPAASARFDENGVAVLDGLPANEDLRFLFMRDRERIVTLSNVRLRPGKRSRGTVTLPSPLPGADGVQRIEGGTVNASVVRDDEANVLKPGVSVTTAD